MRRALFVVWIPAVLFLLTGCRADSSSSPENELQETAPRRPVPSSLPPEPDDEPKLSMARAMFLVQQVPGARAHSLGVPSSDSIAQPKTDHASVEMIMDATRMTARFTRASGHWVWTNATSPDWGGTPKAPADVIGWIATRGR